jgi:two-component system, OmpR family, sensor histidine kinase KdpD
MTRPGYGTLQPNREWVELRETIGRALRQMARPLAPMKIDVQIRDDMPILHVDPVLIEQVLVNILDNAAKYSRTGGRIEIAAALDGEQVRVGVSDEGPGIPPEARDAVFACAPATSRQPGQGLGCRFCRGVVEAHGGRIEAFQGPGGRGTTIAFWLPVRPPPAIAEGDEDEREAEGGPRP